MAPQAFGIAQNGLGNGYTPVRSAGRENRSAELPMSLRRPRDLTPSEKRLAGAASGVCTGLGAAHKVSVTFFR
jgi:hypothetical protein